MRRETRREREARRANFWAGFLAGFFLMAAIAALMLHGVIQVSTCP